MGKQLAHPVLEFPSCLNSNSLSTATKCRLIDVHIPNFPFILCLLLYLQFPLSTIIIDFVPLCIPRLNEPTTCIFEGLRLSMYYTEEYHDLTTEMTFIIGNELCAWDGARGCMGFFLVIYLVYVLANCCILAYCIFR